LPALPELAQTEEQSMLGNRIILTAAAALVVATAWLLGPWRPWGGPQGESALARSLRLEAELQRTKERFGDQRQLGEGLAAGRLTLLQAAARLRAIRADEPPSIRKVARRYHPGLSEEEWLCMVLIEEVEGIPATDPTRAALGRRLRAELRQHQQRGPIRLPAAGR
jgi:hypothetical protein